MSFREDNVNAKNQMAASQVQRTVHISITFGLKSSRELYYGTTFITCINLLCVIYTLYTLVRRGSLR
jgi:hypothetical protein